MSDNYPFNEEDLEFGNSITQEFHVDPIHETKLDQFNFEFVAPDVVFRPVYYPDRVVVGKERDVVREKGICRNEYVRDVGTHNREIHVVGKVSAYVDPEIDNHNYVNNLQSYHDMVDFGQRGDLITMQWSGEVIVLDSDLEGPTGVDPDTGHFQYEYTLDFISTGRDEMGVSTTGIITEGD